MRRFLGFVIFCVLMPNPAFADEGLSFKGRVNFSQEQIEVTISPQNFSPLNHSQDSEPSRSLKAVWKKKSDSEYHLSLELEHFKTPFCDLSSKIESSLAFKRELNSIDRYVSGRVWSQYSLLDYKPTQELSGQFAIEKDRINFDSLSFANVVLNGHIGLAYPYPLDLNVYLDGMDLNDF